MNIRRRARVLIGIIVMMPAFAALSAQAEPGAAREARPSKAALRQELIAVVDAQLKALRADNYPAAYAFASAGLREQMSVMQFAALVQNGYPVIAANTGANFGLAQDDGEHAVLSVAVTSKEITRGYTYLLQKEGDGWRIAGVVAEAPRPQNKA